MKLARAMILLVAAIAMALLLLGPAEAYAGCNQRALLCSTSRFCLGSPVTVFFVKPNQPECIRTESGVIPTTEDCGALIIAGIPVGSCGNGLGTEICDGNPNQQGCEACSTAPVLGFPDTSEPESARATVPNADQPALERLRAAYDAIRTVHLKANFVVTLTGADESGAERSIEGSGTIEYWGEGRKFRIRTDIDPRLKGLRGSQEIAFDGRDFQDLWVRDQLLRIHHRDVDFVPGIPNPFFLAVDFLSKSSDECPACSVRLADVPVGAAWDNLQASYDSVRSDIGPDGVTVIVPGEQILGEIVRRKVVVRQEAGFPISRIDRLDMDGQQVLSIRFPETEVFRGVGVIVELPRIIELESSDPAVPGGISALKIRYWIHELELNEPLSEDAFRISWDQAEYIWAEEEMRYLRHPNPEHARILEEMARKARREQQEQQEQEEQP
jgi:hypothetical protein